MGNLETVETAGDAHREVACNQVTQKISSKNPDQGMNRQVASGRSHQHLGLKKGMVIASLNVNGIRSHLDEVQLLLNNLGIHILALNETKLDSSIAKELTDIAGYQQKRLDRTCHGGGVSIYIRDSIRFKPRDDVPVTDLELICIEIEPVNHFLLLPGIDLQVALLAPLRSWKRFSLFWTNKVKK